MPLPPMLLLLLLALPLLSQAGYVEITTLSKPDACQDQVRQHDRVAVHYTGKFPSGQVFDSSYSRNEPIEFVLGKRQVIPGWEQGLLGMCVDEVRKLVIPPDLAYGKQGHPPVIPPDATLVFETKLVSISRDSGGLSDLSIRSLVSFVAVPALILYVVYYIAKRYKEQEVEKKKAKQLRRKR